MRFALRALHWLQRYSLDVAASGSCTGAFVVVLCQVPSPSGWIALPFIGTVLGVYWLERTLESLPADRSLPSRLTWESSRRAHLALWSVSILAVVGIWLVFNLVSFRLYWVVAAGVMVGLRWLCVQTAAMYPQLRIAAMLIRIGATAQGYLAGGVAFFAPSLPASNLPSLLPLLACVLASVLLQDLCDAESDSAIGRANLTASWSGKGVQYGLLLPILVSGVCFAALWIYSAIAQFGLLAALIVQSGLTLMFAFGKPSPMRRQHIRIAAEWVLCLPYLFWVISRWL